MDYKFELPSIDENWPEAIAEGLRMRMMPGIGRVLFNVGKKAYPKLDADGKRIKDENGKLLMSEPVDVLTTVVFFADGTKVTVTNSENDGVKFLEKAAVPGDPESPKVLVASESSKEMGLVYAICKRLYGKLDRKTGVVSGNGFGRKLHKEVEMAYDTVLEDAKNKHQKKLAKAKYEQSKGTAKPKRPSFADTVKDLNCVVNGLKEALTGIKNR